jgi:hypothetical protein
MFERSPRPTSELASVPASFGIGALSPVSAASCVSSVAARRMRPSAGTMSPASSCTMSPGTMSVAGTSATEPSRTTFACGTWRFASALMLARAVSSCRVPSTTFRRIRSATITPVDSSPIARLTTTTPISMMFIGSRSCSSATAQIDGGGSPLISFGPCCWSRVAASAADRPESELDCIEATTSAASRAYGGASALMGPA